MKDRWLRLIGVPLIALIFPFTFLSPDDDRLPYAIVTTLIAAWLAWELNRFFILRLRQWLRWDVHPAWHILVQASGSVVLVASIIGLTDIFCYRYIYDAPIQPELLRESMVLGIFVALLMNAVYESIYFSQKWKAAFTKAEVLRRESLQSHFESLKNQISPHFLFNSLNTLAMLIEEDKSLALRFTAELGNVYRYVLESRDWKLLPLRDEAKFTETYAFLLQMRFGDCLQFECNLSERALDTAVPPLTLQMLVENAVKHNIISRQKPLNITISDEGSRLIVRNNLQKKSVPESSTKVGLQNISNRYNFLGNEEIKITETEEYFEVSLPLLFRPAIRVDVKMPITFQHIQSA